MAMFRVLCLTLFLVGLPLHAQSGSNPTPPYTLNIHSRIVFLDVTVLDKKNHPVTSGLSQDDFTITEEHQPQQISSFETPDSHVTGATTSEDGPADTAPLTEIVLDRLNSNFQSSSYNTLAVQRYLGAQPAQLKSPTELMLLDNNSFQMIHSYTRSRDELLDAIDHLPVELPLKLAAGFFPERLVRSVSALREIAFRNQGIAGRKNIFWIGNGIGVNIASLPGSYAKLKWFSHDTTNALVDGRMSLFIIYPGPSVSPIDLDDLQQHHLTGLNQNDPFAEDIGMGAFSYETGGTVLHDSNWPDLSIKAAQVYGTNFYTLTYRPPDGPSDGRFRRVSVHVRDPRLHALTKVGYYALDSKAPFDPQQQALINISSEVQSAIPFDALQLSLKNIVRHSDSGTIELTVQLSPKGLPWQSDQDGKSHIDLMLAAVSLTRRRDILASRLQDLAVTSNSQDPVELARTSALVHVTLHTPRRTESVRLVLETSSHGHAGSVEIARGVIDAAKDTPTPAPNLIPRPLRPHP